MAGSSEDRQMHFDAEPEDTIASSDYPDGNSQSNEGLEDASKPLSFETRRIIELDRINRIRQVNPR